MKFTMTIILAAWICSTAACSGSITPDHNNGIASSSVALPHTAYVSASNTRDAASGADLLTDTDLDGMSDIWENLHGTQYDIDDAAVDSDADGVDNIIEYLRGTLPRDALSLPATQLIYVDIKHGRDSNADGSREKPYATLAAAISAAHNGDTLQLAPGTYTARMLLINKSIRIVGPPDRTASIISDSVIISNLWWGGLSNIDWQIRRHFSFTSGRNLTLKNTRLYLDTPLLLAANTKLVAQRILAVNYRRAKVAFHAVHSDTFMQTELDINHSTITGFSTGINWNRQGGYLRIRNSILANTMDIHHAASAQITYSLLSSEVFAGADGNLHGEPRFVDVKNHNYHLRADSPAVDTADPLISAGLEPASTRLNMGFYGGTHEATRAQDNDNDGLPDGWEQLMGLNSDDASDRYQDKDQDGLNNTLEYRSGSLANDQHSPGMLEYFIINPYHKAGTVTATALTDGSYITPPLLMLNQHESTTVSIAAAQTVTRFNSNRVIAFSNLNNPMNVPVPGWLAGHRFIIPHQDRQNNYFIFSPYGDAAVTINFKDKVKKVRVVKDTLFASAIVSKYGHASMVSSDLPIILVDMGTNEHHAQQAHALPPATTRQTDTDRNTSAHQHLSVR